MTNLKYKILSNDTVTTDSGVVLKRIVAIRDIERLGVKNGDLGGYIEHEKNLEQHGDAWVYDKAQVYGDARVCDKARVYGTNINE